MSELATAQAKLRRQQERIQQAEAALNHPPAAEKIEKPRRDPSRAKGKNAWRPLDLSDRADERSQNRDSGVEVRMNRYGAASQGTSLSRSVSSLSQHTTATGHREEMTANDDVGFQLITRHGPRVSKAPSEAAVFTDRPDIEKQKTVEATYNKKEILDVFKQDLPPPDFLSTTIGMTNGHIQFVQHPNGDVAAHMWSAANYAWDNIGHFSNIRKKTEGQLAGERLKGETAYQKLQQHTLAYFRVLAKQREASVTGAPFGQDNIKTALPEPQKMASPKHDITMRVSKQINKTSLERIEPQVQMNPSASQASPSTHVAPRYPKAYLPTHLRQDDPFSTSANDYYMASNWQSRLDKVRSHVSIAQQAASTHERRHDTGPESTPTREALRDQLHKTVDTAMKRSLSQANLARTVLHDPVQAAERSDSRLDITPPSFHANNLYSQWHDPQPQSGAHLAVPANRKTSVLTIGSVPDIDYESHPAESQEYGRLRPVVPLKPAARPVKKSYDDELHEWWTGGTKFARQEELFQTIMNSTPKSTKSSISARLPTANPLVGRASNALSSTNASGYSETNTRILIPVYENLASYVQGPRDQRHDYWCRWTDPPDWCIDRGPNGNNSFYDSNWGQPPARVGRDPRYRRDHGNLHFGGLSPMAHSTIGSPSVHCMGMGSRFGYGRY